MVIVLVMRARFAGDIRSILQGFQKAGSSFLDLGTPLPACLPEELRKAL
jgi:hypothetical protein